MQLISMAWGELYCRHLMGLLGSARRFSLPLTSMEISGEPPCAQAAKRLKPVLLKEWLKRGPVTWVDADAWIHKTPKLLFNDLVCDMAMFTPREDEYWNGTLLLNPTSKTFQILETWTQELNKDGWEYDQKVLNDIIKALKPDIQNLPYSYCWIKDSHETLGPPVIEHYKIGRQNIGY